MTAATILLAVVIGLGLLWALGGLALRLGGALAFWAGLVGLLSTGEGAGALVALLGGLAWLAGHVHHALRRGEVRSPLARAVLGPLTGILDRDRG